MANLKDKQIRLVGSQNFAYATGSSYTQGHVHFTTDEHGSIVVNGKVYGTTDASYIYVGSENIPTFIANAIPNVTVSQDNYNGCYLPKFLASGHEITVTNGAHVVSHNEFSEHLDKYAELHKVVDTFLGGINDYDTEQLKSYIDTLSEIQNAFVDNSYTESIVNSVKSIQYHGGITDKGYTMWITYTTNGSNTTKESAYVNITAATNTAYGLVKYDDSTIKKNDNGQLYVNGALTDTKYSLYTNNGDAVNGNAYIRLSDIDGNGAGTINLKGTGIAKVTYSSANNAIEIYVPEAEEINYNHHSTGNGTSKAAVELDSNGAATTDKFISSVNLSADGTLTYSYMNIKHAAPHNGDGKAGKSDNKLTNGSIIVPTISYNACGHITAYENVEITGIAAEDHSHDEFVWL